MKWLIIVAILSGCVSGGVSPGCDAYGESRITMPRPLPNDALGAWVAVLDTRMTATCR